MDPIKAQKFRAMNLYKKSDPFFQSLILHSVLALACSLFCSYSYSFPNSFYTIKHLLFDSLPNSWSWFVNPGCLFVMVNCIVVFLIGESRICGKETSSPVDQVYNEYVARTRSLRGLPSPTILQGIKTEEKIVVRRDGREDNAFGIEDGKKNDEVQENEERKTMLKEETGDHDEDFEESVIDNERDEEEKEMEEEQDEHEEEVQEQDQELGKEEDEEAIGIPAEELNKRVEDFIARVNKQRWLEARYLISSTRA